MKKNKIICLLIFAILSVGLYLSYSHSHEFSLTRWDSAPEKRYKMVDDLVSKYNIIGMSKNDIIELLGENMLTHNDHSVSYFIAEGMYIDPIYLVIYFDENGVVYKYERACYG